MGFVARGSHELAPSGPPHHPFLSLGLPLSAGEKRKGLVFRSSGLQDAPSSRVSSTFTSLGLALPAGPACFITCATRKPRIPVLPER